MNYNPNNCSNRPRPFRVVFGSVLVIAGLIAGMAVTVHEFHRSSLAQEEPVEIDWQTLVRDGYGDNPHIRLVNVDVIDPHVETGEPLEDDQLNAMMVVSRVRNHILNSDGASASVIPSGSYTMGEKDRVLVAEGNQYFDEAFRQSSETGSIEGMVSAYGARQMIGDLFSWCLGEPTQYTRDDGTTRYVIVPIDGTPDLSLSRILFLVSGFSLALGLILCGSGGPGTWCCFYAPLPALISLIGYPMRYGRGNWVTRVAYIFGGVVLMGCGYFLLVSLGNFGAADGNPIFQSCGFATLFIGLGGVLSVPIQITQRTLGQKKHIDVQQSRKPVRMSWNQACSMEPRIGEVDYQDDTLAPAGSLPLVGELKQQAEALGAVGFSHAESLLWHRENGISAAAIQLGCQQMVVSDLESQRDSDVVEAGLISVLATGIPIITLSANTSVKQNREHTQCLFQVAQSSNPTEMLADHLRVVVNEAESRDTAVVELEPSETRDIVHLTHRVLAEIQGMIDGQIVNVGPKRYGRFHYPPAPVPTEVAML